MKTIILSLLMLSGATSFARVYKSPPVVPTLNCADAIATGILQQNYTCTVAYFIVPYSGGAGASYSGESVSSTGVTGLTATLAAGTFSTESCQLVYNITGTPITNGTAYFAISPGGATCTVSVSIAPTASITMLNCGSAVNYGNLAFNGISNVSSVITYDGGNGSFHSSQSIASTGVTGLTASLSAGTLASGSGNLTYMITGTPSGSGTAYFALSIGGQSCTLTRSVSSYRLNTVHCGAAAIVQSVTNPSTGKVWMDRNLGASQVATSATDASSYGDLYQWGRRADGHQCRNSATTTTLSSSDQPAHGNFIMVNSGIQDWRSPQNNNLWQGVDGNNMPCPTGYRLPSIAEFAAELTSLGITNATSAFSSILKLPSSGRRIHTNGLLESVGTMGYYWSRTVVSTNVRALFFDSGVAASNGGYFRGRGLSVRCLGD